MFTPLKRVRFALAFGLLAFVGAFALGFGQSGIASAQEPRKQPPSAECLACRAAAGETAKACKEAGGSAEECRAKAKAQLDECLKANNCPVPQQPPAEPRKPRQQPPSEECLACGKEAREAAKACQEAGGSAEECRAKAKTQLEDCLKAHSCPVPQKPIGEPGKQPISEACLACRKANEEAVKACVAAGGTRQDCRAKSQADLEQCLTENSCPTPERGPRQPGRPGRPGPAPTVEP